MNLDWKPAAMLVATVSVEIAVAMIVVHPSRRFRATTLLVAFCAAYAAIVAFIFGYDSWNYWRHGGSLDLTSSWLHDVFIHIRDKTPLLLGFAGIAVAAQTRPWRKRPA